MTLASFRASLSRDFCDLLRGAGLQLPQVGLEAVALLGRLRKGPLMAVRAAGSSKAVKSPSPVMGTLIKRGLARFVREGLHYELTSAGSLYFDRLEAKGLVRRAQELSARIDGFALTVEGRPA